jgi:hypothetical protein
MIKTARKRLQLLRRCSPLLGFLVVAGPSALDALAQPSGTLILTGQMTTPRIGHTATRLNDGRVLITGGFSSWIGTELMSAELYDPITGTFALTGNMIHPRESHTATLLADGRVLIVGGYIAGIGDLATAEIYDPATGTFTGTGSMHTARREHSAILLNTGKVLITGGSSELYDPATGAFTPIGGVNLSGWGAKATKLYDGTVLTVGGYGANASLFDPTTETFRFVAFPAPAGELTYNTATLLANGKVLIAGGATQGYGEGEIAQAQIYDDVSEAFQTTGSLSVARAFHTATLLPNGGVLIAGGFDGSGPGDLASAELYDPNTGTFAIEDTMTSTRDGHTATLLGDGRVLIVGGRNTDHYDPSAELYIPADLWQKAITAMKAAAGTDDLNFWQWGWFWQRSPAFPGAPASFGVLGSIDNTPWLFDEIIAAGGGNGSQDISAEQWVQYYRQSIPTDGWQRAIAGMQALAGTNSLNSWQWAWFWQRFPAFPGAPAGLGVLGSISPDLMGRIVTAGGGDGSQLISAGQWVVYFRQVIPQ